jgi:hypothetical protein
MSNENLKTLLSIQYMDEFLIVGKKYY